MSRWIILVLCPALSAGCSHAFVAVDKPVPTAPTSKLQADRVPDAAAVHWGGAVESCSAYSSVLGQFAGKVQVENENRARGVAGGLAWVAALTAASGAVTAALGGYFTEDKQLRNTALAGGIVTAALGIPAGILASRGPTQADQANAARTGARAIDEKISEFTTKVYEVVAGDGTADQRGVQVHQLADTLTSECRKQLHASNMPLVPPLPLSASKAALAADLQLRAPALPPGLDFTGIMAALNSFDSRNASMEEVLGAIQAQARLQKSPKAPPDAM